MKRLQNDTSSTIAKVNVTPIIDVALVLVIILMITAPMIAVSDVDVKLPEAQTRNLEGHDRISITVGPNGDLAVDKQIVTTQTLEAAIAERLTDRDDVIVVIRADQSVAYSAVRKIVEAARSAGAARIAVGTQQQGTTNSGYEHDASADEKPVHDAMRQNGKRTEDVKS